MNKIIPLFLFIILILFNSCQSGKNKQDATEKESIAVFEQIWNNVNEHFYDQNFNGVDWDNKYKEYKGKIENCNNTDTLLLRLNKMLFELNSSHCGVGLLSELDHNLSPYLFKDGEVGIDIRILENKIVVTSVLKNSAADISKIKSGYIIEKIDGLTIADIEKLVNYRPPYNERNNKFHLTTEVLRYIYGQAETNVKIDYLDENNQIHSKIIKRTKRQNGISLIKGMSTLFLKSDSYFETKDIAYLSFNVFQPANLDHVLTKLENVSNSKGLIIDLRGNDGGSIEGMKLLLGRFVSERKKYGTYINRNERNDDFIEPLEKKYPGEVVLLIDEMSISGAENMAGIVEQFGIGKIIGNQSPGQLLWGNGYFINDSIFLAIPIYKLEYPNGFNTENKGITPDIEIKLNRSDLLKGKDTQKEKAVQYLEKIIY
jgi:carboxyl-terminal processing protease